MADGGEGEDEIQFLRTDDEVVLQCTATIHKEQQKLCLAAEGFGNRLCFLESTSNSKLVKNPPATQETWVRSLGWKILWRRERLPTPVFWPGEFRGLYSPGGCKELDTTERLPL